MLTNAGKIWRLLRSQLSRHVAAWVFVSISSVGLVILVPAYRHRQIELLEHLEHRAAPICRTLVQSIQANPSTEQLSQQFVQAQQTSDLIVGLALYRTPNRLQLQTGEHISMSPQQLSAKQIHLLHSGGKARQVIIQPLAHPSATLVLILDASTIQPSLNSYRNHVLGLILLTSTFATITTLGIVSWIVIRPMHQFRRDLLQLGKAAEPDQSPAEFYALNVDRQDEIGQVMSAFGELISPIYQMVQDRLRAEQALKVSEEKFATAFHANPVPMAIMDPAHYTYVEVNQQFLTVLGWKQAEVIGRTAQDLDLWIDPQEQTIVERLLMQGWVRNHEITLAAKDRSRRTISFSVEQIQLMGECQLLAIYEDISDRKQTEQALTESQERLMLAFYGSGDALWDWDLITNQVYYSEQFWALVGGETVSFARTMDAWLDRLHPEDHQTTLTMMQRHLEHGDPFQMECRLCTRGGVYIWVGIQGRAIWNDQGTPIRMAGSIRDINERKQAEAALRKSEARFALAAEGASAGIWDWDLQTHEIYFSPRWKAFLGYTDAELPNQVQTWENSIHPDERAGVMALLQAYLERTIPSYEVEFRALHKDGSHRWILARGAALWDEQGVPYRMSGSHTDITDLKRRERDLDVIVEGTATQIGDQFFRSCVGHLATALEVRYAIVSEINPARDRIQALAFWNNGDFGKNFESPLTDTPAAKLLHGTSRRYPRRVQEHFPHDVDLHVLDIEGYFGVPIQDSNGQVIGILAIMDTEPLAPQYDDQALILKIFAARAGAELERKQAVVALEQQLQVATLLEGVTRQIRQNLVPDAILQTAVDQLGKTFKVNRCVIHSYNSEPLPHLMVMAEYLEPNYPSLLHVEMPIEGNAHVQMILAQDQAIATPNVMQEPLLRPVHLMCELMQIKSMLAVRTSSQGQATGVLMLCQCDRIRRWTQGEIELLEAIAAQVGIALAQAQLLEQEQSQRRALTLQNQAMEEAKQDAEVANRAKSDFLANMSHELRTPLNAILGFTQIMARDATLNTQQREQVTIINRSGEHLLHLINDILDMSKIEAGHMSLVEDRLDLFDLLATLDKMLSLRAKAQGLTLVFARGEGVPQYIYSDGGKLRQILLNLLGNAIKFTAKGTVTLRVQAQLLPQFEISAEQSATEPDCLPPCILYFEVEDTGPGIAPDEIDHLFEAFVQTEAGRKSAEGSGLGLPISRRFVQMLGGELTVSSIVGQGTSFQFNAQVGIADGQALATLQPVKPVMGLAPGQPTYRILVVDDQATNRQVMTSLLAPVGFDVRTANNGEQALTVCDSWHPHLIWMDMRMPVMDGYEATQRIKAARPSRAEEGGSPAALPIIIALTASVFDHDRGDILGAGCDGIVRKPFQEAEIFGAMAQHLGVTYLYAPEQPAVASLEAANGTDPGVLLTPELLSRMPLAWIEQLYGAAIAADEPRMYQLMQEIPDAGQALSQLLSDAVQNFRLEQIIDVAEATLGTIPASL